MKFAVRILSIVLLLALVGQYFPLGPSQPVLQNEAPQLMPPYPGLYDKIKKGEVELPRFMTDPAWARSVGLEAAGVDAASRSPLSGQIRVLAVLIDFSDQIHVTTATAFDSLIFQAPQINFGSVRDYFYEVSYGQVDIVTVNLPSSMGWKRAPNTYSYYTGSNYCLDGGYPNNCQKLAEDVINAIDGVVDFRNYDNNGDGYCRADRHHPCR